MSRWLSVYSNALMSNKPGFESELGNLFSGDAKSITADL